MASTVPNVLLIVEADLEDPEDLDLADVVSVLRDLVKIAGRDLEPEVRVRVVRAMATTVARATDLVRLERGAVVRTLFEGGLSYPAIGDLFGGVTGERARQWAQEAPAPTTDNRSNTP